jgi:hypothetical protein
LAFSTFGIFPPNPALAANARRWGELEKYGEDNSNILEYVGRGESQAMDADQRP